jgi:hypothetical protein
MPILQVTPLQPASQIGLNSVNPSWIYIQTNDTQLTVTTAGYFNQYSSATINEYQMALVYTTDTKTSVYGVSVDAAGIVTLSPDAGNGNVVGIPVTIDDIPTFANTNGALKDGSIIARAIGFIQSGTRDSQGGFIAFSGEGDVGTTIYASRPSRADSVVIISNDHHDAGTSILFPDSGAAESHVILSDSPDTQYINTGNVEITQGDLTVRNGTVTLINGNLTVGFITLHSNDGVISMFPGVFDAGKLDIIATANADSDVTVLLTNASHAASTVVRIPDSGATFSNFILSEAPGDQFINSGGLSVSGGDISTGSSGIAGSVFIYPAAALSGSFRLLCSDAAGNYRSTLTTYPNIGQSTTYTLGNAATANQSVLVSSATNVGNSAALISIDQVITFSELASGGVFDITSGAGYRIRDMVLNLGGTNFSGIGGNRNIQITDGTTVYTVIPAAVAQALVNAKWGTAVTMPYPVSASVNTETVAALKVSYSGGTTDYTAGSLTISFLLEKVT